MQFKLFHGLSLVLPPAQRERVNLLKGLDYMMPVQKSGFIQANCPRLTGWEKDQVLQQWVGFDQVTRTKLFDAMYPFCNDEQKILMREVAPRASSGRM